MRSRVLRDSPKTRDLSTGSCILCGANQRRLLYLKDDFEISKCMQCELVYTFPQDLLPLEMIYGEEYYRSEDPYFGYLDYEGYERLFKKTFGRRLAEIEKRAPKGHLLDIGCALGFFVEVATKRGWDAYGIDISPYAVKVGQSRGLHVLQGTVEQAGFPSEFFHVVTIWDLFEGLADPLSTLNSLHQMLRSDGLLVIGTPNVESLARRVLGSTWAHFKPKENRFYYSPRTIKLILKKAGFEVASISSREGGQYCDLRFISEKLRPVSSLVSRALMAVSSLPLLREASFCLNSLDRMVVYASKRYRRG